MGDKVFIRVASFKHLMKFRRKGKQALQYINPYEIVEKIGKVAHNLCYQQACIVLMMYFMSYRYASILVIYPMY